MATTIRTNAAVRHTSPTAGDRVALIGSLSTRAQRAPPVAATRER